MAEMEFQEFDDLRQKAIALGSAPIGDGLGKRGQLPAAISRISGSGVVAGPTRTARCADGSGTSVFRALLDSGPGDVLLIQLPGEFAAVGEMISAEATRRGLAAIVVDGLVRDVDRMAMLDLSVFARGTTPRGAKLGTAGADNIELELGETLINPGDWLIGDNDGIVAVTPKELPRALGKAEAIAREEAVAWRQLRAGTPMADLPGAYGDAIRSVLADRIVEKKG